MMDPSARANLYGFFSRIFIRELDQAAVSLICSPLGQDLLPKLSASNEMDLIKDETRRRAIVDPDFVHLTVVNVVPYASFYLRDDAKVEAGLGTPIAGFLESYGFEIDLEHARSLAQDHIGIALEALYQFCLAEAEAMARPDLEYTKKIRAIQHEFLEKHVLNWVPIYLFAVERCAHTLLYGEAAQVLMSFLASDYEMLENRTATRAV